MSPIVSFLYVLAIIAALTSPPLGAIVLAVAALVLDLLGRTALGSES